MVDIIADGFDAVIRSGNLSDSRLMSRRLGAFRFVLCASVNYLERCGVPATPADLDHHTCVMFRYPSSGKLRSWSTSTDPSWTQLHLTPALICNNMEAVLTATIDGYGIACMPDFLAKDAIERGALRPVLDEIFDSQGQFWVLWPSSRQLSPNVRVFVDFISERLFTADR